MYSIALWLSHAPISCVLKGGAGFLRVRSIYRVAQKSWHHFFCAP